MSGTQFKHDCPHCGARMAGFRVLFSRQRVAGDYKCDAMAVCGVCDEPISVTYTDLYISTRGAAVPLNSTSVVFPSDKLQINRIVPAGSADIPDRLPENVARFFKQGMTNEKSTNWDAAGAMFRKSIDVATKGLDDSLSSFTLFKRINQLAKSGKLTNDIALWAHEVRIEGNDSVHGDDPETPEDVAAIHEFARAVLLYLFTLPALVAERATLKERD